jgi:hypothetical protein
VGTVLGRRRLQWLLAHDVSDHEAFAAPQHGGQLGASRASLVTRLEMPTPGRMASDLHGESAQAPPFMGSIYRRGTIHWLKYDTIDPETARSARRPTRRVERV